MSMVQYNTSTTAFIACIQWYFTRVYQVALNADIRHSERETKIVHQPEGLIHHDALNNMRKLCLFLETVAVAIHRHAFAHMHTLSHSSFSIRSCLRLDSVKLKPPTTPTNTWNGIELLRNANMNKRGELNLTGTFSRFVVAFALHTGRT